MSGFRKVLRANRLASEDSRIGECLRDPLRIRELLRDHDELIMALHTTFALIESGYLVRDTSHDHEPGWAIKQVEPMRKLATAAKVLAKHQVPA